MGINVRARVGAVVGAAALLALAGSAQAAPLSSHGQLLHLAKGAHVNTNQSNNWFGYNQGTLEKGNKLFNSISGDWTVPAATQHTAGQAESSSDWIGIGAAASTPAAPWATTRSSRRAPSRTSTRAARRPTAPGG